MNDAQRQVHEAFEAFKHTSDYKDRTMMGIMLKRKTYEEHLDEMWRIYCSGNLQQVVEYKKQVQYIKSAGLVVQRHKTTGKHRIIYPK